MADKKFNVYSFDEYYETGSDTHLRDWIKEFFDGGLESYSKEELVYTIDHLFNADPGAFAWDDEEKELEVLIEKSLAKIKSFLGEEKYIDYRDNAEEISLKVKDFNEKLNSSKEIKQSDINKYNLVLGLIGSLIVFYLVWAVFIQEKEDCITITYQDFDSNYNVVEKRGRVCGDARHQVHDRWKDD